MPYFELNAIFTKFLDMDVKCSRNRSIAEEQKRALLRHYLLLLKEYREAKDPRSGKSMVTLLPKGHLYRLAGERAFYTEKTAGKYIREMLDDDQAVREAMKTIDSVDD